MQDRLSIRLAERQIKAVQTALTSKIMVITGGPGTGKTTIINAILKIPDAARSQKAPLPPAVRPSA
ncbi:MAG: AAA family ATPase [Desulfobacterales bacterium]